MSHSTLSCPGCDALAESEKLHRERAIICINACAGMADPAKEIAALRYTPLTHKDAKIAELKARIAQLPHEAHCEAITTGSGPHRELCTCAKGART